MMDWHVVQRSIKEETAMKCPKCRYVSHDYLDSCRKCRTDLVEFKRKFKLMVLQPGDLDLGILVDVGGEGMADRDGSRIGDAAADMASSVSLMTNGPAWKVMTKFSGMEGKSDETTVDTEIDIHLDTDNPNTSTEPGELTKTFYVPEALAPPPGQGNLPEPVTELDEMAEVDMQFDTDNLEALPESTTAHSTAAPDGPLPSTQPVSSGLYAQQPPVHTSDMSVGNLENCFDEFEDIQLDTTEIDHDIDLALDLPSIVAPLDETDDMPTRSAEQNADTEGGKRRDPEGGKEGREI
jgi:hypothetical protein